MYLKMSKQKLKEVNDNYICSVIKSIHNDNLIKNNSYFENGERVKITFEEIKENLR